MELSLNEFEFSLTPKQSVEYYFKKLIESNILENNDLLLKENIKKAIAQKVENWRKSEILDVKTHTLNSLSAIVETREQLFITTILMQLYSSLYNEMVTMGSQNALKEFSSGIIN